MTAPAPLEQQQAHLKGSAYLSTLRFIDSRFGSQGRAQVVARLTPEDRELLAGLMLPISWYPLAPFPRLLRAMDESLGRGDLALVRERGTWAAIADMKTTHKVLLRLASPSWVIEKGTALWSNFHDTGHWSSGREGDRAAFARLEGLGIVDPAMCATLGGWIIGLLTISGCKGIDVQHTECRAHGHSACVYRGTWL